MVKPLGLKCHFTVFTVIGMLYNNTNMCPGIGVLSSRHACRGQEVEETDGCKLFGCYKLE